MKKPNSLHNIDTIVFTLNHMLTSRIRLFSHYIECPVLKHLHIAKQTHGTVIHVVLIKLCVFTYAIFIQIRCKIKINKFNLSQCFRINGTPFFAKAKFFEYWNDANQLWDIWDWQMSTHHPSKWTLYSLSSWSLRVFSR